MAAAVRSVPFGDSKSRIPPKVGKTIVIISEPAGIWVARRAATAIVIALAVVIPGACGPQMPASHTVSAHQTRASIFAYPWVWTDDRGERVAFSRWRGQELVVTAIYTRCKSTCPRTIGKLQQIHETLRHDGRNAQFFLVTLDPETDTSETLRGFKASEGFPDSWHLLTGSVLDTRELRDVLDIHVLDDGPHLMHDAKIVVFDARGNPSRSFGGWALDDETAPP
jgi:cytochrome oxidase Cu insertion factor (SCO1/SenC/PrrC family)